MKGVLEAPPQMVEEISSWAIAQFAANALYTHERRDTGDPVIEEFFQGFLIPRVRVKRLDRARKKFTINLEGWKYQNLVDLDSIWYSQITVSIKNGRSPGRLGCWKEYKKLLFVAKQQYISANGNWRKSFQDFCFELRRIIRHELQHFAQDLLSRRRDNVLFGLPPTDARNPAIDQHMSTREVRAVSGLYATEIHSLDDIEFHTRLADEVEEFRHDYGHLPKEEQRETFRLIVGLVQKSKRYSSYAKRSLNVFFRSLKIHNKRKWVIAVGRLFQNLDL